MGGFDIDEGRATRISPHRAREARQAAGLAQHEVAAVIGVSQGLISHWECGMASPDASRIAGYAAALGVEPHELFDPEPQPEPQAMSPAPSRRRKATSDTFCAVCERRIVGSTDGTQWWHWPENFWLYGGLDKHAQDPYLHNAQPPVEADNRY